LPVISDPNLIAGIEHFEDAGVYKLSDDLALIQTLDFFTPIVDDPYIFGQIAAVNALSDVYAMGGRPLTAMNIICFPVKKMDISVLHEILRGGLEKMREAGVTLVGGHSVEDDELKYGLSVTGTVHPDRVLLNSGACPGDLLILTKALGTGIVSTAIKGEEAPPELMEISFDSMLTLNRSAAEVLSAFDGVHACTDITGFGFLGHACEMAESSRVGIEVDAASVPVFPGIRKLVDEGFVPGGLYRNRDFRMPCVSAEPSCPQWLLDILFDPQTSGGLLASVRSGGETELLDKLRAAGVVRAAIIGRVVEDHPGKILVR
jgi:selenide,water dikinase